MDAIVRVPNFLPIRGPAESFCAEVKGNSTADFIDEFLDRVDGCDDTGCFPRKRGRILHAQGLEDGVLDHEDGGAVGVPDAGDPDVVVEVDAAVVGEEFAFVAGEVVKRVGRFPPPVLRDAVGPCRELSLDFGGVVEDGG